MEAISHLFGHPAFWIAVFAIEEVIAYSPLKSNSVVQLIFQFLRMTKGKR